MNRSTPDLASALADLCHSNGLVAVFVFGSREQEIAARLRCKESPPSDSSSDLDLAILPPHEADFNVRMIVRFASAVEDLFGVPRADIVDLRKAPPYLALDAIKGELLYSADDIQVANFELFVLRRAGDLAFHERERRRMLLKPRTVREVGSS